MQEVWGPPLGASYKSIDLCGDSYPLLQIEYKQHQALEITILVCLSGAFIEQAKQEIPDSIYLTWMHACE